MKKTITTTTKKKKGKERKNKLSVVKDLVVNYSIIITCILRAYVVAFSHLSRPQCDRTTCAPVKYSTVQKSSNVKTDLITRYDLKDIARRSVKKFLLPLLQTISSMGFL